MKQYELLEVKVLLLGMEDVIRTSNNPEQDNEGSVPDFPELFG